MGWSSVTFQGSYREIAHETKSYVCIHVFDRSRPVLYVTRPDGDWCALCGDDHPDDANSYRVVGIGHVIDFDPTVAEDVAKAVAETVRGSGERQCSGSPCAAYAARPETPQWYIDSWRSTPTRVVAADRQYAAAASDHRRRL